MVDNTRTPVTGSPATPQDAVVSCWMCGIHLNPGKMVPDGTSACNDIRWYCQDTQACTQRWTASRTSHHS